MNKLQNFAYNPNQSHSSQEASNEEEESHPATPLPQRIPLSDLMSNTPRRQEDTNHDVSPEEKVVWKLSPKKTIGEPFASQESPNVTTTTTTTATTFLNLLNEDERQPKVCSLFD